MGEDNTPSSATMVDPSIEDDLSSCTSSPSVSSIPSSPGGTTKTKKPRKNKPTNLILGPVAEHNTVIPMEIIKIAEEKYVDEAVKINDGTFRFGDQIAIGQDGIHSNVSKLTSPSSGTDSGFGDFSMGGASPSSCTSVSFVNNDNHIQYSDLEEVCKLGRGASSTVYKVVHKKTGQIYAMKKINVDLNDQKPKLIVSEFKALYNNDCPYVMTLYDAYYRQGCILMVLKFMDCGSLEDILTTAGRIPESILSRICEQMIIGLEYMHTVKKVVHRDIKPANVLVHSIGEVCIADFGMAGLEKSKANLQALQQTVKFETYCGSALYMSPERIKGMPHSYDSDIWSFGLTIAEAYLGVFPFVLASNSSIWDILNHLEHSDAVPFPLEGASDDLKDFIYSTLHINRKQRPSASSLRQHPFITKYQHKKPQFLEKWLYYSYIAPRQLAKHNRSLF